MFSGRAVETARTWCLTKREGEITASKLIDSKQACLLDAPTFFSYA